MKQNASFAINRKQLVQATAFCWYCMHATCQISYMQNTDLLTFKLHTIYGYNGSETNTTVRTTLYC